LHLPRRNENLSHLNAAYEVVNTMRLSGRVATTSLQSLLGANFPRNAPEVQQTAPHSRVQIDAVS
jgi:hypothetical protein